MIAFRVYGTPKPQGSKRHVGNGVMVEQGGEALRLWREDVKQAALQARDAAGGSALVGALQVSVDFTLVRPRSHYRTGKNANLLRPAASAHPAVRPDLDKLLRSTFDACTTARLWTDDSQVVQVAAAKRYVRPDVPPGAYITVTPLDPQLGDNA